MREQEFQQNHYCKRQRVGRGRESMRARLEEKHMNYDGSRSPQLEVWCARVALSRMTKIIHATIIKYECEDDAQSGTKLSRDGTP